MAQSDTDEFAVPNRRGEASVHAVDAEHVPINAVTDGVKIRAQIVTENVKGLLLVNGGAAVALLAFLSSVLDKPGYEFLAYAILWSLLLFQAGLVFAVAHNWLRHKCSLIHDQYGYKPPPGEIFGINLHEPRVCWASDIFMWLSVVAFIGGGLAVFGGGLKSLHDRPKVAEKAAGSAPKNPAADARTFKSPAVPPRAR
jgi:hypothetical protein